MQPNPNNNPLLEDEDRPAGSTASTANSTAAAVAFVAAPGAVKKKIVPVNEAAVREALAQAAKDVPPKRPLDTTKIYNEPSRLPGPPDNEAPPQPGPQQTTKPADLTATMRRGPGVRVSELVAGLQLYAMVMLLMSGLSVLGLVGQVFEGKLHISRIVIFTAVLRALPILAGIYLLAGKRAVVIRALLIVIGLIYAYSFVSYGILILKFPAFIGVLLVAATAISGGLVYWTWRVYSNVESLEEASES